MPSGLLDAVPYACTDLPTEATNEMGQTCADFNLDPHFKFEITRGFGVRSGDVKATFRLRVMLCVHRCRSHPSSQYS